ncbi:MAG: TIGR03619 family F420-dependent LLM class oxidoreductase [Actinomycetota bacterium]|nr:TIGR03619 family F420-dependent LLM class oxidoreductase [Actinomycetota bacterium]
MDIGLHLPSAQPGATADGIRHVARIAEDHGFDSVWMFDHLFTPTAITSKYPYTREGDYPMSADDPFFDPLGLFGVLAGEFERIKIGTGVLIAAYRNPIVLGKMLATIENFAPGRIILGVGAGWMKEEFDATGVDYDNRGARLVEYIEALRTIWSGEPSAFDGRFYSWVEASFLPAPTRPIPIVIGGHGDKALERVAQHADGWAAVTGRGQGAGIAALAKRIEVLAGFLDAQGRNLADIEIVYTSPLWFSDHSNEKLPLTGPPEHIAGSVKELGDLGVTTIDLAVFGPAELIGETAQRFAEEVRPLL